MPSPPHAPTRPTHAITHRPNHVSGCMQHTTFPSKFGWELGCDKKLSLHPIPIPIPFPLSLQQTGCLMKISSTLHALPPPQLNRNRNRTRTRTTPKQPSPICPHAAQGPTLRVRHRVPGAPPTLSCRKLILRAYLTLTLLHYTRHASHRSAKPISKASRTYVPMVGR